MTSSVSVLRERLRAGATAVVGGRAVLEDCRTGDLVAASLRELSSLQRLERG